MRIRTDARTIATSEDTERPHGAELTAQLLAVPTAGSSGNALYGVGLEQDAGPVVLLIASPDPSEALRDLAAIRAKLSLRVVGGWGLPAGVSWADRAAPQDPRKRPVAPWDDRAARRPIAAALFLGAATISVAIGVEIKRRLDLGDPLAPLSIGLPLLGLSLLLLVTLTLVTGGVRMELGVDLCCERRVLGVTYSRRAVKRSTIRNAYLVSPSGHHAHHLLLDTDEGPIAFPCDDVLGTKIASEIARAVATAAAH